jgi:hypothetical protein
MWRILFLVIVFILLKPTRRECFTDYHNYNIKKNARDAYNNKSLFKPDVKYQTIKNQLPWVDPVSYDDMYKLSLKEQFTISNLEETLYK